MGTPQPKAAETQSTTLGAVHNTAPAAASQSAPSHTVRSLARAAAPSTIPTDILRTCIHCGLCTSSCPTYLQLGTETDSPRGRIHLMRAVQQGEIDWTAEVVKHLDLCLECRACETACPSGVHYSKLLEAARDDIAKTYRRALRERLILRVFRDMLFPYPSRLRATFWPVRVMGGLVRKVSGILPRDLRRMLSLLPAELPDEARYRLPEVVPAVGERRYRVALLTGCIGSVLFARTNWATARVLAHNGCEVVIPRNQGCCGALHLHSGASGTTREFARRNLEAFDLASVDAVIVNAAGCGSTVKEYGDVLAADPAWAGQAAAFSAKTRDISEFLAEIGLRPMTHEVPKRVAYHDACHLAHGQGIRIPPREILSQVPGLELCDLRDSELCCGSAGLYNILQPEMAERLLQQKIDAILETGAQLVATGNPGCLMQIAKGLRERHTGIDVVHPVEILAQAYGERLE